MYTNNNNKKILGEEKYIYWLGICPKKQNNNNKKKTLLDSTPFFLTIQGILLIQEPSVLVHPLKRIHYWNTEKLEFMSTNSEFT